MATAPADTPCPSCSGQAKRRIGAPALGAGNSSGMRLQDATRVTAVRIRNGDDAPAVPDHPGHAVWKRDFNGAAAVFSIVLRPELAPLQGEVLRQMRLFKLGASWGGVHSLVAVNDPRKGRTSLDWLPSGPVWRHQG